MLPCYWGGVAHTANHYGLDGPGFEHRFGRNFLFPSRQVLRPIQPFAQWVPGLISRSKGAGVKGRLQTVHALPLWAFVACSTANFTLFIFILLTCTALNFWSWHSMNESFHLRVQAKRRPALLDIRFIETQNRSGHCTVENAVMNLQGIESQIPKLSQFSTWRWNEGKWSQICS
jgi:hypothetical protein